MRCGLVLLVTLGLPAPGLAAIYTVTNTADSGPGSMRQAFIDANASAGMDTIRFNVGGGGPVTIAVGAGGLPILVAPVVVDGTTQPGYAGMPLIEIDGSAAAGATAGIDLQTSNSVVRGFIVHSFPDEGLEIDGITGAGDNNVLAGNWVGIDAAGTLRPNADNGVLVTTDADGNTVGGTGPFDGNVICGSGADGLLIRSDSDDNLVLGNRIGVLADGVTARANTRHGIEILTNDARNRIGGTTAAEANVIAHNGLAGIGVSADAGGPNRFQGNRILANAGLGIDLGVDGVTANDGGDGDAGPNGLLNFPVIHRATILGANLVVAGEARPGATVEVFVAAADPSGHGEGRAFVGRGVVAGATPGTVDATARWFAFTFALGSVESGDRLTATATDAANATSEFAANATVTRFAVTTTADVLDGDAGSLTNLVANPGGDGEVSLREAIVAANNTPGTDSIPFRIAAARVGGVHTISPAGALPTVTGAVHVDGTSEPDFAGTPVVELSGATAGAGVDGLRLAAGADGSTVRGLIVNRFGGAGIRVDAPGCGIHGNRIGTDAAGTANRGNAGAGVLLNGSDAAIGGVAAGAGNVIAFNGTGVTVLPAAGSGNSIVGNAIHANMGLGIDLGNDGVTANDGGDGDAGANGLLNFPVLTTAAVSGGQIVVEFDLDAPAGYYRIDFYRNPSGADPGGYGEGETVATSFVVSHPGGGAMRFPRTFPGVAGDVLTATTTVCADGVACAALGGTSEFGAAATATALLPTIVKRAYLPDGTPLVSGATLPRGTDLEFILYVNSPGGVIPDVSLSDALDPGFAYIGGTLRYDASTPSCPPAGCTPAGEATVYAALAAGTPGTEVVDGDVVSFAAEVVRAGDQDAANARLDLPAGRVWALRFRVRMQ